MNAYTIMLLNVSGMASQDGGIPFVLTCKGRRNTLWSWRICSSNRISRQPDTSYSARKSIAVLLLHPSRPCQDRTSTMLR